MAPIVHGLEARYHDKLIFTYLDIDDPMTNRFKQTLSYRYQPHIFLLDADGVILKQWIGVVSERELESAIEEALAR